MCLHCVVVHSVGTTAPSCFVSFLTSSSLRQLLGALLSDKMNAEDIQATVSTSKQSENAHMRIAFTHVWIELLEQLDYI
jgi:hypothetical protein